VTKCAGFLHQGVSLVTVDVVTTRTANLHDELADLVRAPALRFPDQPLLYASAWMPLTRGDATQLEVWAERCTLDAPLPTLPLRLEGDAMVPIELGPTYEEACRRRRIAL
jgi:hypothetical protein